MPTWLKKEIRLSWFQWHTKVNNDDDDDDDEKFKRTGEMKIIIERVCMEQLTYSWVGTMSKSETIASVWEWENPSWKGPDTLSGEDYENTNKII